MEVTKTDVTTSGQSGESNMHLADRNSSKNMGQNDWAWFVTVWLKNIASAKPENIS